MASVYGNPEFEQIIRGIAPAEAYGSAGLILSRDFGISIFPRGQSVSITGDFSGDFFMQTGFNCLDISELIEQTAKDFEQNLRIVSVEDEIGIWHGDKKHFCCLDSAGRIIDGTPIFPFFGAEHDIEDEEGIEARVNRTQGSINPIKAQKGVGITYVLAVDFIDIDSPKEHIAFRVADQRVDSFGRIQTSFLTYHLDVKKYRQYSKEKAAFGKKPAISFDELVKERILIIEVQMPKRPDFGRIFTDYSAFISIFAGKLAYAQVEIN